LREYLDSFRAVAHLVSQYTVGFDYRDWGVNVNGRWFPMVKMNWVEGPTLTELVRTGSAAQLASASHQLREMSSAFRTCGFIHGDIHPDNLILSDDGLKIVDYDRADSENMTVLKAAGNSGILRHPRDSGTPSQKADTFAAWVIDTGLLAARLARATVDYARPGRFVIDNLDLVAPDTSLVMQRMLKSGIRVLELRAAFLKVLVSLPLDEVPPLNADAFLKAEFAKRHNLPFPPIDSGHVSTDWSAGEMLAVPVVDTSKQLMRTSQDQQMLHDGFAATCLLLALGLFTVHLYPAALLFVLVAAVASRRS
jgi:serine/threonine protein kinase